MGRVDGAVQRQSQRLGGSGQRQSRVEEESQGLRQGAAEQGRGRGRRSGRERGNSREGLRQREGSLRSMARRVGDGERPGRQGHPFLLQCAGKTEGRMSTGRRGGGRERPFEGTSGGVRHHAPPDGEAGREGLRHKGSNLRPVAGGDGSGERPSRQWHPPLRHGAKGGWAGRGACGTLEAAWGRRAWKQVTVEGREVSEGAPSRMRGGEARRCGGGRPTQALGPTQARARTETQARRARTETRESFLFLFFALIAHVAKTLQVRSGGGS